mmetsp:Transcript_16119/g.26331  ORF Transcript_16119/g.26331 Transcript_16119/m.26331 type:complete len:100 (+) Transcript_16119:407-706(+)
MYLDYGVGYILQGNKQLEYKRGCTKVCLLCGFSNHSLLGRDGPLVWYVQLSKPTRINKVSARHVHLDPRQYPFHLVVTKSLHISHCKYNSVFNTSVLVP